MLLPFPLPLGFGIPSQSPTPPLPHFPSPSLSSSWEPNYLAEAGPVREDQLYYYSVLVLVLPLLLLLLLLWFSIKCPLPCCSEDLHKDEDIVAQPPGQGTALPSYLNRWSCYHIAQTESLPDPQPCRAPSRFGLLYKSHTVSGRFHYPLCVRCPFCSPWLPHPHACGWILSCDFTIN